MNRGSDHQTVFFDDISRLTFERLLGEACTTRNIEVHAYCLMGNHFHLLVHCPEEGPSPADDAAGHVVVHQDRE